MGEYPRVQIVRPGTTTAVGTVISFAQGSDHLTSQNNVALRQQASIFKGKPQKIEVRRHTSRNPVESDDGSDFWNLAYRRCRNTTKYLVNELGIDPKRIRISLAGPHEPIHSGTDFSKMKENPRVEVCLCSMKS